MLAKLTSKNQLTLPKSITAAVGTAEYFDVEASNGRIVLTPVRIQRGDAVLVIERGPVRRDGHVVERAARATLRPAPVTS